MTSSTVQSSHCDTWIAMFTRLHLDGAPSRWLLEEITAPDVRFRDPFNDLQGREAIRALFVHTLKQIADPRFLLLDQVDAGDRVYLKWEMHGRVKLLGDWRVTGMSELVFDESGRLLLHQDFWDASEQFYARLPVIGWLLRRVRKAAAIHP